MNRWSRSFWTSMATACEDRNHMRARQQTYTSPQGRRLSAAEFVCGSGTCVAHSNYTALSSQSGPNTVLQRARAALKPKFRLFGNCPPSPRGWHRMRSGAVVFVVTNANAFGFVSAPSVSRGGKCVVRATASTGRNLRIAMLLESKAPCHYKDIRLTT